MAGLRERGQRSCKLTFKNQPPVWPCPDLELINWIVDRGTLPLEDLKPQYFRRPGDKEPTAIWIIDRLFPNNPSMNFFENGMDWVGPREGFRGDADPVLWSKHAKVLVPGGSGVGGHKANIEFYNVGAANGLPAQNAEGVGK
jgi:hypothetical protein